MCTQENYFKVFFMICQYVFALYAHFTDLYISGDIDLYFLDTKGPTLVKV